MEVIVIVLAVVVLVLVIQGVMQEGRVNQLTKKVDRLEQQSVGFMPASYAYLNDLEEWAKKKER